MLNVRSNPSHTSVIYDGPADFSRLVRQMVFRLRAIQKTNPFTMLAGCGNSGLPLLGALGLRMKLPIISVRKEGDINHDCHQANGDFVDGKYMIVDDLISLGDTMFRIRNAILDTVINSHRKPRWDMKGRPLPSETVLPQCAGILLYSAPYYYPTFSFTTKEYRDGHTSYNGAYGPHVAEEVPCFYLRDARVAQLVEQLICNQ